MQNIKKENKVVLLSTSTTFPYIKDTLDLLFLPSGIQYRFRYRKELVSAEFLTKDGARDLIGRKAIIVHIHTEKNRDEAYKILEFIPLREAKIDNVRVLGEFLWIQFILGDWIHYHNVPELGKLNEHHDSFKERIPKDSREYVNKIMLFVDEFAIDKIPDDPTGEKEEVIRNWTQMARHIGNLEPHQNSIFTKVLCIKDINTRESISPSLLGEHITGYQLRAGRVYSIEVAQYHPKETEMTPFNLNLITSTVITPIKGEAEIKGKYDILQFIIDCKSSEKNTNTFMAFRVSQRTQYMVSEPFFDLRIKGGRGKTASALIVFGIGVILTNISAQLGEIMAGKPVDLAVISAAIVGTISSTLGLYLLHRS
jgi:hypothetical protein